MKEYVKGVQHIGLPVKDYDASCAFYKKLDFSCVYETKQPNEGKVGFFQLGNLMMEIYEAEETAGIDGAIDHIALDCADIEAAYEEAGCKNLPILTDGIMELPYWDKGIKYFHVEGPDGEKIEFCQKL
ncbi:MAG: VOC family protein [Lachnospiraceae bacterium]|nr:VOC family protein [Lachnospiraceae bacterium]MDD3616275.1 VOC family protein [Lachnospiraceae bacterium]